MTCRISSRCDVRQPASPAHARFHASVLAKEPAFSVRCRYLVRVCSLLLVIAASFRPSATPPEEPVTPSGGPLEPICEAPDPTCILESRAGRLIFVAVFSGCFASRSRAIQVEWTEDAAMVHTREATAFAETVEVGATVVARSVRDELLAQLIDTARIPRNPNAMTFAGASFEARATWECEDGTSGEVILDDSHAADALYEEVGLALDSFVVREIRRRPKSIVRSGVVDITAQ